MERFRSEIIEIRKENPETYTYIMKNPHGHTWESGANTHVALNGFDINPGRTDSTLVRHMSILTAPEEGYLAFTTRIRNNPSRYKKVLMGTGVGDYITIYKSKAHMRPERNGGNIVCFAMGVAVAAFRPFVLGYFKNQDGIKSFTLIYSDREGSHIFPELFEEKESKEYKGVKVSGRIALYEKVREYSSLKNTSFYIAGSDDMMVNTVRILRDNGVSEKAIFLDRKPEIAAKYMDRKINIRPESSLFFKQP